MSEEKEFTVTVPGSKSITNRALLLAALSEGTTTLYGALFSDDSRVFVGALREIGYPVEINEINHSITITGGRKYLMTGERKVYVGSAGTAARFITAMLALSGVRYEVTSSEQMKKRPMKPLLLALEELGVTFEYKEEPYAFPFNICGWEKQKTHQVSLNIDESSQFLSALLMAGVLCPEGLQIRLCGKRNAKSYVAITEKMMKEFGVIVRELDDTTYEIAEKSTYQAQEYQIEPDVSAACYFYGLAAISGRTATVKHVRYDSMQGDIKFLAVLEKMGCQITEREEGIRVTGPERGKLVGVDVDMSDFSDQTMTLAAIAPFAEGRTIIRNVEHIRRQESDRLHGTATELKRLGIQCIEEQDGLIIEPGQMKAARIHTYEDHRMAMAFGILATQVQGVEILNPECCSKTFEEFFQVLDSVI